VAVAENRTPEDPSLQELRDLVAEIQQRVRARHATNAAGVSLPDLMPLLHARDAAEGKVASIGTVNPRRPGPLNFLIQAVKRLLARALSWHVREQIEFNRAVVTALDAILQALEENNRVLREVWERKLQTNEMRFLRGLADLQAAFHLRASQMEENYREVVRAQHQDFTAALETVGRDIQTKLWQDLDRVRREYESLIHNELRLLRQRAALTPPLLPTPPPVESRSLPAVDWLKFAEKFRGPEEEIRRRHRVYVEKFRACHNILDLGCGRGEFLELMRDSGLPALGLDLNGEMVALCRQKGLQAVQADLFAWLEEQPDRSFDGVFCSHIVEHLPPSRLPDLIRSIHAKLRSGGTVVIETPNPECLAIFATHFYLDPTHERPVPPKLLAFYLEEQGFGSIETIYLEAPQQNLPQLLDLPERVRQSFFGALDYAIVARKLS
jgi:O-antigen chain-terminating methyltransferase